MSGPNALFVRFLTELEREAIATGKNTSALAFQRACNAARKYPLFLLSVAEAAAVLDGVTEFVARKLEAKFTAWKARHAQRAQNALQASDAGADNSEGRGQKRKRAENLPTEASVLQPLAEADEDANANGNTNAKRSKKNGKTYSPKPNSGAWAILVGMYKEYRRRSISPADATFMEQRLMTKNEVIRVASPLTHASFVKEVGSNKFYTAWDSVKGLVSKGLMQVDGRPQKFSLTESGYQLAETLFADYKNGSTDGKENDEVAPNESQPAPAPAVIVAAPQPKAPTAVPKPSLFSRVNRPPEPAHQQQLRPPDLIVNNSPISEYRLNAAPRQSAAPVALPRSVIAPAPPEPLAPAPTLVSSRHVINFGADNRVKVSEVALHVIEEVILIIDNREKNKKRFADDATTVQETLQKMGLKNCEPRQLLLGDFLWIGRTRSGVDVVLDSIVERKKLPDLISSIVDKRYKEQKFRLKKCVLDHVIYLVEGEITDALFQRTRTLKADGIESALASTQIEDEFFVVRTITPKETWDFLKTMTAELTERWKGRRVAVLPDEDLSSYIQTKAQRGSDSEPLELVVESTGLRHRDVFASYTIRQFNEMNSKGNLVITELFAQQLMALCRCSPEAALAITKKYPTMQHLHKALNHKPSLRVEKEQEIADMPLRNGRRVGPKLAQFIVSFVTGSDPNQM